MDKSGIPTEREVRQKVIDHLMKAVLCNSLSDLVELALILEKEGDALKEH